MPYFRASQLFWLRLPYLWIQSLLWWISIVSYFDIQVNPCWNRTLTYHFPTSISLNHDWTLGGCRYIHLTKRTNADYRQFLTIYSRQRFPCIQTFPRNRLPIAGSPNKSFSLIHTSNWMLLHNNFIPYNFSCVSLFSIVTQSMISPNTSIYWVYPHFMHIENRISVTR